jgi:hypothetical protein
MTEEQVSHALSVCEKLADAALELRAFKTDEEKPEYLVPGSEEWKEVRGAELAQKSLTAAIFHGSRVNPELIDQNVLIKAARDEFERAMHFNPLDWENKELKKLSEFIVAQYEKDNDIFEKYDKWRKDNGRFLGGLSNKKILEKPTLLISCFPDFLAMTVLSGEKPRPEHQPFKREEKGDLIPNPKKR